jgi:hypothetical protein
MPSTITNNVTAPVASTNVAPGAALNVVAAATSTNGNITGWQVYLDSVQLFNEAQTATSGVIEQNINKNLIVPSNTALGNHTLQVKAFDATGNVKVVSITPIVVATPVSGVITQNVTLPAPGASINSDGTLHVTANATTTAAGITAWEIWIDSTRLFNQSGTSIPNIDQIVTMPSGTAPGNHTLLVKTFDNTGTLKTATLTVVMPSGSIISESGVGTPLGTRTVASFTAHNVSSAANYNQPNFPSLFTGSTNHDGTTLATTPTLNDDSENAASPIVISKETVRNLMPAGWTGRIGMHMQAWWGFSSHPGIGFSDQVQATMDGIIQDFADRGYDLVILDWYSPTGPTVANDTTADIIISSCAKAGIKMALMIDEQYFADNGYTTATYQTGIIAGIQHLMDRYAANPAYETAVVGGVARPLMLLWGIATKVGTNVNWSSVRTAVQPHANPLLIQYQAGGFGVVESDGALGWLDTNADNNSGIASGVTYLTSSFLPACSANQGKICMSSVWKGFNGTLTKSVSWSLGKYLNQQSGQTWLDVWAANAAFVAGGKRLDYVCTVTADDFQEGSAVQCGIRTNVALMATLTGNILGFTMTGNESSVRRYNLWGSIDGVTAILLDTILPTDPKQFDLTALPGLVTGGNYTLYLEAQGMPSLQSHMAPQTFQRQFVLNTVPPSAILSSDVISGLAPLTVNFDASQSTDANSAITNYRFDFGDSSSIQSGVSQAAQHIYNNAGVFTCILTITDAAGNTGTASVQISVGTTPVGPNPTSQLVAVSGLAVAQATTQTVYEIPLLAQAQTLSIKINGVTYKLTVRFNTKSNAWNLDIASAAGKNIVTGIPLVTGADLLDQYKYLNLGGKLVAQTDGSLTAVPTFTNLGSKSHLFLIVE